MRKSFSRIEKHPRNYAFTFVRKINKRQYQSCFVFNSDPLPAKVPFVIDEASFNALYNRYWYEALSFAQQLIQDSFIAEDIVQNVFISLWKRKDSLQINQPVAHYLKRAVKLAVAAHIRDTSKKEMVPLASLPDVVYNCSDAPMRHRELVNKLAGFVEQLPDQNQKVYHMRFSHAMDNPQIADVLGISEKTVRNQLSLALKRIRAYLVKEGY
jgi:RNA polymerase sigma-70 factor (ECF subfamily)